MKSLATILLAILSIITNVQAKKRLYPEKPDILFLLGGQSNMQGKGFTKDLPETKKYKTYKESLSNVSIWDFKQQKWVPVKIGNRFGPEIGFAHTLSAKMPDRHIGLIKYAKGGTSMVQWRTTRPLYKRLMTDFKAATATVPNAKVGGLLWHQGESDSDNEKVALAYEKKVMAHIAAVRKDTGISDLLVVVGEINPAHSFQGRTRFVKSEIIKSVQASLPKKLENVAFVPTSDLEKNPYIQGVNVPEKLKITRNEDNIHFSAKGQINLGIRFAKAYLTNKYEASLPNATTVVPKNLDLFLLIGQSNMAGRAPLTSEVSGIIDHCYLLNDKDLWEAAQVPLNRYSTVCKSLDMQKLNPGYSFAKTMISKGFCKNIGLVCNARGGSNIASWKKGNKHYKEAVRRTKQAIKAGGRLRGILWHQGESDDKNANYLKELEQLIKDLRTEFGEQKLPFVAGQVNNVQLINEQIAKLPALLSNTNYTSSEGLKAQDRWHFDTKSQLELGKRYAKAMSRLLSGQK